MSKPVLVSRFVAVLLCVLCQYVASAHAQEVPGCGSLRNAYGPFDYRDPVARKEKLPIVEEFHFTPDVEMLVHGTSGTILGDLNYTLRAFPNHPRALQSLARYALQGGKFPDNSSIPTADCYFQRAMAFAPDDPAVRVIYGDYLFKRGDTERARKEYEKALRLAPDSPEISYDAGLFFVDMGDIERAKQLAKVAYSAGYPLPGLRKKIAAAEAQGAKRRRVTRSAPPAPGARETGGDSR